jgi:AcrR family transcriptional regulator
MARTESAVVDGVGRCLAESGARRTTMIDIAAAAGIAKGTLYNHVRTKAEAYDRYADAQIAELLDLLAAGGLAPAAEAVADHPVAARLRQDEPDALAAAMLAAGGRRDQVLEALEDVVGAAAPVAYRWLLSLLVDPGDADERAAAVAVLTSAQLR